MCGVLCTKRQAVAVSEISAVESFRQGISPVEVSLHSDLGRKLNHDSQQLQLSPTNRHPRFSSLKTKLEDSQSKDKVAPFVYLEDESNGFIKEEKITDDRQMKFTQESKPVLKTLKRSKRDLKEEIDIMTDNYIMEKAKQCCWDGYEHYIKSWDCHRRLKEMKEMQRPRCYKAFQDCCTHTQKHYEKHDRFFSPLPTRYCVSRPKFWKVSEQQVVKLDFDDELYYQDKIYFVKIMLLSYPDKNVTYDSQEFLLNPSSRTSGPYDFQELLVFPLRTQSAVSLLIKLEDLPKGDELEKFVYLVISIERHVIEKKVPLLDLRVTQLDLKKPKGSTDKLEREIEILASKYHKRKVKKTCRDAYKHYIEEFECQSRLQEFNEGGMPGLYRVFQKCCLHTREYIHRMANTEPDLYNINDEC